MKKANSTLVFFLVSSLLISAIIDDREFNFNTLGVASLLQPDSTYEDSTEVEDIYDGMDTAYSYVDGKDSIYLVSDSVYTDTMYIEGRLAGEVVKYKNTNNYANTKIGTGQYPFICEPLWDGTTPETVQKGLYGINVSGMFDNATCPYDGSAIDQWDWLSDLKPQVLRFPHGANGKFMHLLHDVTTGDTAAGYGYDLSELIRYFDGSDGNLTNLVPGLYATMPEAFTAISAQSDANIAEWNMWMDNSISGQFGTLLGKWQVQQDLTVTATDHSNYLTDFIKLIRQIETDNPGHVVNVLVALNIISETSSECAAIVSFLRSNPIHNVNVVGVELGNEVPSDFHWRMMGFAHFSEHATPAGCDASLNGSYWSYINGEAYTITAAQTRLNTILSPAMQQQDATGHYINRDYIKAFKYNFTTSIKVGLPGEAVPGDNLTPAPIYFGGCPRGIGEWNDDMVAHYGDEIATVPPGLPTKKFNAVILHIYLDDNQNWGPPIADLLNNPYTDGLWNYATYDSRLQPAFDGILFYDPANPDDDPSDSFMGFIKHGHKVAWDAYRDEFNFTPPIIGDNLRKEMWMTEYNIKTNVSAASLQRGVYTNGFTHGFILQEWFLKNLKMNFTSGYKKNFFTYATYQNYAGIGEDLITPAERPRELYNYLCLDVSPYNLGGGNPNQREYYMKRTGYFVMSMLKEISSLDLKYVKTRFTTHVSNANVAPTMFIDEGHDNLYMYFSNIKATEQDYLIIGDYLAQLYDPEPIISFDDATIRLISASQLYSNSGESSLFDPAFNTAYTNLNPTDHDCYEGEDIPPAYFYPIEMIGAYFTSNSPDCATTPHTPGGCITVPPYSMGYVKIPIIQNFKQGNVEIEQDRYIMIYPNPANTSFTFYDMSNQSLNDTYLIEIYSMAGILIESTYTHESIPFDIAGLAPGVYMIRLISSDGVVSTKNLVKIN